MLIEFLETDFEFDNENGKLVQLVHDEWKQVNVIFSKASGVRGGHYHKYNEEAFYIYSGSFKLIVWQDDVKEEYEIKAGDMFKIKPLVFHTFEYCEDTILVSLYSNGVEMDNGEKDIWTE